MVGILEGEPYAEWTDAFVLLVCEELRRITKRPNRIRDDVTILVGRVLECSNLKTGSLPLCQAETRTSDGHQPAHLEGEIDTFLQSTKVGPLQGIPHRPELTFVTMYVQERASLYKRHICTAFLAPAATNVTCTLRLAVAPFEPQIRRGNERFAKHARDFWSKLKKDMESQPRWYSKHRQECAQELKRLLDLEDSRIRLLSKAVVDAQEELGGLQERIARARGRLGVEPARAIRHLVREFQYLFSAKPLLLNWHGSVSCTLQKAQSADSRAAPHLQALGHNFRVTLSLHQQRIYARAGARHPVL